MQSTRESLFLQPMPSRMLQILTSAPRTVSALAIKWSLGLLPMGKELSAEWKQTQLTRTEIGRTKQCRAHVCVCVCTCTCRQIVTCAGTRMVLLETQSRREGHCIFEPGLRRENWLCNANEIKKHKCRGVLLMTWRVVRWPAGGENVGVVMHNFTELKVSPVEWS